MVQRRSFIKTMAAIGGAAACSQLARGWWAQKTLDVFAQDKSRVKRVLAVFKCHFDVGFVDTQERVIDRYFREFFPAAIRIGEVSRQEGNPRYIWTTGSWLLYEYLEQASPAERLRAERAISAGDLAWHALPFSLQTELLDRSQIEGSLSLSRTLDARFGKRTTGAKMTDVPGHTRGLIAPLAAHGVTFLDIGVNGASRPAEVPPMFVWKDEHGSPLTVMYHHNYGAVTQVGNSDIAVATIVRFDNSGPHKLEEIRSIYANLQREFQNAKVVAATLSDVAGEVAPHASSLPTVTQEIGDTWIYGVPSDPIKVARYRELSRLRQKWISRNEFAVGDKTDRAFLAKLLLAPEHTWGTDTKTWLDFDNYKPDALKAMLPSPKYRVVAHSWEEKRQDLLSAMETLPARLRHESEHAIADLQPRRPNLDQSHELTPGSKLENRHMSLQISEKTGAIEQLTCKRTGCEWASPEHPIALLSYQTLSQADYDHFFRRYIISDQDWVVKDFGKPNIDRIGAVSRTWLSSLKKARVQKNTKGTTLLLDLSIADVEAERSGLASFPELFTMEIALSEDAPVLALTVSWFGKRATRLPESLWLTFQPNASSDARWSLDKCSAPLSPHDVVRGGARMMHALSSGFTCASGKASLFIETIDAPVVALGERSPLNFSMEQPEMRGGVHSNLFNNAWGTNYIQWFGEDCKFRYRIHLNRSDAHTKAS